MIRRDHGVEFAAYCAHKYRVCREWAGDARLAGCRQQHAIIFVAEAPAIARVRVQRAES
jgi:hypothetical protein